MPAFLFPEAKDALLEVEIRVEEEALNAGEVGLQGRGVAGGGGPGGRGQPVVGFVVAAGRRRR